MTITAHDGVVSWVHFGDLHMTARGEQNHRDFGLLIDEVNGAMRESLDFAYLPGDNADHGAVEEYEIVRGELDRLQLPWIAITGDHDVHKKSHENFSKMLMPQPFSSFESPACSFFALDAFAFDDPKRFDLSDEQLDWLSSELSRSSAEGKRSVFFLHCYPSELGTSSSALKGLIRQHRVLLVDMGHTHYNEISNDGLTIYTATRSTGQIEEGPVGFSVTNLDGNCVSWRFKTLGEWPLVMITSPADERLHTAQSSTDYSNDKMIDVRAKVWSDSPIVRGRGVAGGFNFDFATSRSPGLWQASIPPEKIKGGDFDLRVEFFDAAGKSARDAIRASATPKKPLSPAPRDTECVAAPWPEHGTLGTQLGPNKNGRKW